MVALSLLAGCTATAPPDHRPASACSAETDTVLKAWAAAGFGGTVAISTGGEFDCLAGYGTADRATGAPNTPDTVFAIGSVTKAFTAAAVFSLVDQGKVELDAPVARYLPELVGPVRAATIRQLLLHTSGLNGTHGGDHEPMSSAAATTAIDRLDLAFPPGERHLYSNAGYTLLALVVERLGGYRDLMASRVLPPGTGFWNGQPAARGPRAVGYLEGGEAGQAGDFAGPFWGMEGNGGIAMSAKDLASWTRALFTGHVVSPASTEAIASPGVDLGEGRAETPGWVAVDASAYGTPFLSTAGGGGDTGHNVVVAWVPEQDRVVVIASNGSELNAEHLLAAIGSALLAGEPLPRPTVATVPTGEVDAAIVGTYTLGTGGSFGVTVEGERPVLTATGADAIAALFPRRDGFGEHEDRVTALLDGRTREGREERAQLAESFGVITEVAVDGTLDHGGELRTYVTIVADGRPLLGWYTLNEEGGIEAVEVPTTPPSLGLAADGARFRPDDPAGGGPDVTVSFGANELTVTGPGASVTARRAG